MDESVISIEAIVREFGKHIQKQGFSKVSFQDFIPYQTTETSISTQAVTGLILSGELIFKFEDHLVVKYFGDQFFVPENTYYRLTASDQGAKFLFATNQN